jgi:hypothetical protein
MFVRISNIKLHENPQAVKPLILGQRRTERRTWSPHKTAFFWTPSGRRKNQTVNLMSMWPSIVDTVQVKNQLDATKYAVLLPQHVSGTNMPIIRSIINKQLPLLGGHIWKRYPSHHWQTLYSPNHHTATHRTITLGLTILHIFSRYGHLKAEVIY